MLLFKPSLYHFPPLLPFCLTSNLLRSPAGPPEADFYVLELLFCLCPSYRGCLLAAWQPRVSKVATAEQTVGTAG